MHHDPPCYSSRKFALLCIVSTGKRHRLTWSHPCSSEEAWSILARYYAASQCELRRRNRQRRRRKRPDYCVYRDRHCHHPVYALSTMMRMDAADYNTTMLIIEIVGRKSVPTMIERLMTSVLSPLSSVTPPIPGCASVWVCSMILYGARAADECIRAWRAGGARISTSRVDAMDIVVVASLAGQDARTRGRMVRPANGYWPDDMSRDQKSWSRAEAT